MEDLFMGEEKKNFKAMGAQSIPYEELSDIKQKFAELKRAYQKLYVYTANLTYKIQLKDQKIDALYCRMYGLAEMPKRKKDRKKIRRTLQRIENRPWNKQNDFLSLTDFLDVDMLPVRNVDRPRGERRGGIDPFGHSRGRYNNSWMDVWHNGQDMDYDGYEYE